MNISTDISQILKELDQVLPAEDIERAEEYLSQNEFGIAFELICTQIVEYKLKISKELFYKIEFLARQMNISTDICERIETEDISK